MMSKDKFRNFSCIVLVGLGLAGCGVRDIYPFLVQKCQAGETENINGVPVAHASARLKTGEEIAVGQGIFRPNIIRSLGGGAFSVTPTEPGHPAENLFDGRIVLLKPEPPFILQADRRITLTHLQQGDITVFDFALNCQEPTAIP